VSPATVGRRIEALDRPGKEDATMDEYGWQTAWPRAPLGESPAATPPLARLPAMAPGYAGFWRRFLASFVDGLVVGFVYYVLSNVLSGILTLVLSPDDSTASFLRAMLIWLAVSLTVAVVVDWLYFAIFESSTWQATLGKRALGVVVTDLAGERISFGRATGRHFAHYLSSIFLIGFLIQPFTARRQALHDLIAGTLVVRV
jgi:uncharacterized RDD family membrane protein YckC